MKSLRLIAFLAWRNCVRYRKRMLQSFLVLFCGTLCIMLVDAYLKGYSASAATRVVDVSGNLDVHAAGYLDSADAMPLDLSIESSDEIMRTILMTASSKTSPGIVPILVPSIETGCMLSDGTTSRAAPVIATEAFARAPERSSASENGATASVPINPLLTGAKNAIVSGHFYRDRAESGAILDKKYADRIGISVGSPLILLGNDAFGSFSMLEIPVIGIVREASLPGEAGCLVDIASFAPAFGLEGKATAISLWYVTKDGMKSVGNKAEPQATAAVIETLGSDKRLKVRPFAEISASYTAMFDFLDSFLAGMMAVFAVVASVGMCNAILLSVQDRTKDIGTLRAIAVTSRQAGALIYAETFIVGVTAAFAALAVGCAGIWILAKTGVGIVFELSDMGSALPDMIRPGFYPARIAAIAGISAVFPIIAAALPARAARKLTIRECFAA
jgi:putative ABC transport system permease protein